MINVSGKATIYKYQDKGKFATAAIRVAKKNKEGKWDSEFYNVRFCGTGYKGENIEDKTEINIINGILETTTWQEKKYTNIIIFDYELTSPKVLDKKDEFNDLPF